ncbi:MAG TPA: hypothetical protein QGF58_15255, partial [Myxococcota bacterium]|nr:hypothetical protein [Myxococcota bacterium]
MHERTGQAAALYDALGLLPSDPDVATQRARIAHGLDREVDAVDRWREVLEARPDDAEAATGLEIALAVTEAWAPLQTVLRERLERTEDPVDRERIYLRLAGAYQDPAEALAVVLEAFSESPGLALGWEMGHLAGVSGAWDRVEAAYDEVLSEAKADDAAPLQVQLAEWAVAREDLETAESRFQAALTRSPTYPAALDGLERLIEGSRDPSRIADWLERRAELDDSAQARKARRVRLAYLSIGPLEDPARALLAWVAVLDDDPEDVEAWRALPPLYERLGSWPEVVDALERLAGVEEPVRHLRKAADVCLAELDDPRRAGRCLDSALEAGAEPDIALSMRLKLAEIRAANPTAAAAALRPALDAHPANLVVLETLVRLYEAAESSADVDDVLSRLCGLEPTVERWKRLGQVRESVGDEAGALDALLAAMDDAPGDGRLAAEARRLAEATDRIAMYAEALFEARDEADDPDLELAWSLELGATYADLGRHDHAEESWRRALVAAPENAGALAGLQTALEAQGKHDEVPAVLAVRASLADDPALHLQLGELLEAAGDDPGAAAAYVRAGDLGAAPRVALCERLEDWPGLYEALGELPTEPEISARRARIAAARLGRHEEAADRWREVLEANAGDDEAVRGLEHALEVLERWDDLVVALRGRLERTTGVEARRRVYERIAGAVHDPSGALDVLLEAFAEHPDPALAPDLGTLAAQADGWSRLWSAFDDAIEQSEDEAALPYHMQLATWSVERGLFEAAARRYEAVLAVAPANAEALAGLEAIVEAGDDPERLADWLERRALLEDDPAQRRPRWARLAGLAAGPLHDPDRAVKAWRAVLADDAADAEALRAVPPLYEQLERWDDLADGLEAQARIDSPVPLLKRAAEVALERLEDSERAASCYEQALAADPPVGEAIAIRLRLAAVRRDASPAVAAETLRPALELEPTDVSVLSTLADLYEAAEEPTHAVEMLERLMVVSPDEAGWRRLAQLAEDAGTRERAWGA